MTRMAWPPTKFTSLYGHRLSLSYDYLIIVPLGNETFLQVNALLSLIQKNNTVLCKSNVNEFHRTLTKFNKSQRKYTVFQKKQNSRKLSDPLGSRLADPQLL